MEMTEYLRVQRQLMDQIHKGVYRENGKLPTERELCEQFGVSRITIRQALQNMENEGVIVRQQGRGTFVKPRRIEQRLSSSYSFSEELRKQNIVPGTRMLSMVTIPALGHIQQKLELGQGVPVRAICRLRLANEMPYAYETSYIPLAFLSDATAEEIAQNGLYNTLRRCSGREVEKATEVFEAVIAPQFVVDLLGRKGVLSAMQMERTAYCAGQPVEYCESFICGDKYRFHVTLE